MKYHFYRMIAANELHPDLRVPRRKRQRIQQGKAPMRRSSSAGTATRSHPAVDGGLLRQGWWRFAPARRPGSRQARRRGPVRAAITRRRSELWAAARALFTRGEAAFGQGHVDRAVGGRCFYARARSNRGTPPRSAN
jgi:hypothetical protein